MVHNKQNTNTLSNYVKQNKKARVSSVTFNAEDRKNFVLGVKQRKDERRVIGQELLKKKLRRDVLKKRKQKKAHEEARWQEYYMRNGSEPVTMEKEEEEQDEAEVEEQQQQQAEEDFGFGVAAKPKKQKPQKKVPAMAQAPDSSDEDDVQIKEYGTSNTEQSSVKVTIQPFDLSNDLTSMQDDEDEEPVPKEAPVEQASAIDRTYLKNIYGVKQLQNMTSEQLKKKVMELRQNKRKQKTTGHAKNTKAAKNRSRYVKGVVKKQGPGAL